MNKVKKIWEIGVGEPYQSRTSHFINTDIECWLFEPNPISFAGIKERFEQHNNFKLFNFALGAENKNVNFFLAKGSSYIEGFNSPDLCGNPNSMDEKEKISVQMKDMQQVDPGDIDVLLLDTEGSEYDIIKRMNSRPRKIVIEMYSFGVKYKNPYFDQILEWMNKENYMLAGQAEDFIFEKI